MNPNTYYVTHGLSATPHVLNHLIKNAINIDWEKRPAPERFNLREMMAHLADMEEIWLQRILIIRHQTSELILGRDPDELASLNHYETADPNECLQRFIIGREKLLTEIKSYSDDHWHLTGRHNEFGEVSILQMAQFMLGHDGYHLHQVVEWIS